jgi:hypothetical protein
MKYIIPTIAIILSGCVTIQEYDAEKMEYLQVKNIKKAQSDPFYSENTPSTVRVIEEDDVYVEVHKLDSLKGAQDIELQVWSAMVTNNSDDDYCTTIAWKLQDFEFESPYPTEFLLKANEKITIGKMRQTIWAFDGAYIALPPSGYAESINLREPDVDKKTGIKSCEFDESNIDTI